jgi:hypothetical protein
MNLTPFLHTATGLTVYMESDPSVSDFRATGASFEARTAPFIEDAPKLKAALKEAKQRLKDQNDAKLALIQARIDAL